VLPDMDYLPKEWKAEIKKRIAKLESLEFGGKNKKDFAIILFKTPNNELVKYGKSELDKGNILLAIVEHPNTLITTFWHVKLTDTKNRYFIPYDTLLKYVDETGAGTTKKPITIGGVDVWKQGDQPKREIFKPVKTASGDEVRYFASSNRFETVDGVTIDLAKIFTNLKEPLKNKVWDGLDDYGKEDLVNNLPPEIGEKYLELLESSRKL
jgi:hypothetical protein